MFNRARPGKHDRKDGTAADVSRASLHLLRVGPMNIIRCVTGIACHQGIKPHINTLNKCLKIAGA